MTKELPLWMPSGSIRAVLALVIVVAFTGMCVMYGHIEALGLIAVMVVKDYFEMRKQDMGHAGVIGKTEC